MLSNLKLPQKLASPLGLFVNDAKLAFRTQPSGIRRLAENRNIKSTDSYWDQYTSLFDSSSDVFSLISSNDIRRAVNEAPENVETLVTVISTRLFNLIIDHTFPSPPNGVASFASSFIKTAASTAGVSSTERNPTKEVLNCLRILSRVLPVLFETDNRLLEQKLMWTRSPTHSEDVSQSGVSDESSQFVIADEDDEEGGVPVFENIGSGQTAPDSTPAADSKNKTLPPTLAERLISCAIDLLFCCGFTLPSKIQVDHHKINYVIWEKGVGATMDAGSGSGLEHNKVEVLRFLLIMLSKPIYSSPTSLFTAPSQYSLALVQRTPRRHVLTILCSLLNTAMNSPKPSMPTSAGGAIGTVASSLPYNHLVFKGEDVKELFVGYSLQVLCALLDFKSDSARETPMNAEDHNGAASSLKINAFRYFLAKLHRSSDFDFILEGIFGILEQHMNAVHNFLPGSRKPIPYVLETVILLWKAIDLNKKFRGYVLESGKVTKLLSYLLCHCMEAKDKPQQHGVCRAISYIIQSISSEKTFNGKLATPMKITLPTKWTVQGNLGDFMINSIYTVISTSSGQLNSLYPSLIISLSNSAPYFKNLSIVSANRLVSLLSSFSNPVFLFSDEGHPRILFFLLEVFNGIIQNQLNDNPNVIYAVIRSHKLFEELGTFTLAKGLREIKRIQLTKDEQAQLDGTRNRKYDLSEREKNESEPILESRSSGEVSLRGNDAEIVATAQPLLSPSGEEFPMIAPTLEEGTLHPSDKARGKMPAHTSSLSEDVMGGLERLAASGIRVGRNNFVPTQEWVSSWQQGLPLDTVLLAISELLPKVQELQASSSKANNVSSVVDFLRTVSLNHVLPTYSVPSPRRFVWSDSSSVWLTSLLWGEIYVRNMTPLGIWNATNVRLFHVKHTQSHTRQLTDAVSSVVGGLGGFLGRNNVVNSENLSGRSRPTR